MRTPSRITGTLLALLLVTACEKDDLQQLDAENGIGPEEGIALKNYNNGMIKSYSNEVVLQWNEAIKVIENKMPPPAESRMYAMISLAIHDALNNIVPKYEAYALDNSSVNASSISRKNISQISDAAVSQAAHDILTALFPPSKPVADVLLEASLARITDQDLRAQGVAIGAAAASAMFLKRQGDLPLGFSSYTIGTDPGVYQSNYMPWVLANPPIWPANAAYGVNLGLMTPYGMASSDQFRAIPPDPVNSAAYTEDYNEVKRLGCNACPERTAEQTEIGAFWVENVSSSLNRVARDMSELSELDGWETARLLALLHISQIDANISSFEGKYYYKYWRPISAVRAGDFDGNDDTAGDVTWTPTFTTPPTPEYPSTHAYTGGAGSEVLKRFFKTDDVSLKVISPYYLPGVERNMTSFTQLGRENAISRIYIGYHFRKAVMEGEKMGHELGGYIFDNSLKELKK